MRVGVRVRLGSGSGSGSGPGLGVGSGSGLGSGLGLVGDALACASFAATMGWHATSVFATIAFTASHSSLTCAG